MTIGKLLKNQIFQILLIFIIGGSINVFLTCSSCLDSWYHFRVSFTYAGFLWLGMWKGSEFTVKVLDKRIEWIERPKARLLASSLLIIVIVFIVTFTIDVSANMMIFNRSFPVAVTRYTFGDYWDPFLITVLINVFMHGRGFLFAWRKAAIDMERMKTEQVSTQYESLKNQVNPHFLFNSLNALSSLVYEDQDKAVRFIRKLSDVYRYVLDSREQEVIELKEEIEFLRSFVFLQKIRFGENLQFERKGEIRGLIPPMALQILVENAIKHNVVSQEHPLKIDIDIDENYISVKNNLREKKAKDSTGIGLENLKSRYQYLTDKEVVISKTTDSFVVKLPTLNMQTDEVHSH